MNKGTAIVLTALISAATLLVITGHENAIVGIVLFGVMFMLLYGGL